MARYRADDNTTATAYAGWELVDTSTMPARTIAIGMPEADAKRAAAALNACDGIDIATLQAGFMSVLLRQMRELKKQNDKMKEQEGLTARLIDHLDWIGWGDGYERECADDLIRQAGKFQGGQ